MSRTKRTVILVLFLSLGSKLLGFMRDILITSNLGVGSQTDAILLAITIPTLVFSFFQTAIRTTFSPVFSANYLENSNRTLQDFNRIKSLLFIALILVTIFVYLFSKQIIYIVAPGLDQETLNYAVNYLEITSLLILTYGVFYTFTGFLQSIRIFSTLETASISNNIVILVSMFFLFKYLGVYSIIFGYLLGSLLQMFISVFTLKVKTNYKIRYYFNFYQDIIKRFMNLARYVFLGSFVAQLNVLTDKFVASFLDKGSISALHYANLLKNLPLTILVLTLTNVLFPNLSISYKKDKKRFFQLVYKQLQYISYVVIYISIIMICLSEEITKVIFYRGQMDLNGIYMISSALVAYSIGMIAWSVKEIFSKVSYAVGDSKVPFYISCSSLAINFTLNWALGFKFGHSGIALATSISYWINCLIYYMVLKRKIGLLISKSYKSEIRFLVLTALVLISGYMFWIKSLIHNMFNSTYSQLIVGTIILTLFYIVSVIIKEPKKLKIIKERFLKQLIKK